MNPELALTFALFQASLKNVAFEARDRLSVARGSDFLPSFAMHHPAIFGINELDGPSDKRIPCNLCSQKQRQ